MMFLAFWGGGTAKMGAGGKPPARIGTTDPNGAKGRFSRPLPAKAQLKPCWTMRNQDLRFKPRNESAAFSLPNIC